MKRNMIYSEDIDYDSIGKKIKLKREEKSLTQDDLAELAGISTRYVSKIETNSLKSIGLKTLFSIASVLETNIDYYLTDNEKVEYTYYSEVTDVLNRMKPTQRTFVMDVVSFLNSSSDKF